MEVYKVGGAVRDHHMGLSPKDVDYVVVGSTPEEMEAAGFKQVGADFPVFLSDDGTEYALARTERKTGRGYNGFSTDHSPTVTLADDLMRRDLTINAMAMHGNATIDPFGGFEDLENKVLRHVSEAFADDPVRVLRLARFHARFGPEWTVAPETLEFCRQMVDAGELEYLTRERVLKELEKALSEDYAHLFFATLESVGALAVVLPEMADTFRNAGVFLAEGQASAKMRYAALTMKMSDPVAFEARMNVSVEWRRYSKMWRVMCEHYKAESPHPVDTLYAMDAYRQRDLWEEIVSDFAAIDYGHSMMRREWEATKDIGFAALSPEQQSTLTGPAVAEAIKELRKKAV